MFSVTSRLKEKYLTLIAEFAYLCYHPKMNGYVTHSPARWVARAEREGKISQWAELSSTPGCSFCLGDSQRYGSTLSSQEVANGLDGFSGTWKTYNWQIGDRKVWGISQWTEFFIKYKMYHVNVQKAHPQHRKILIKDKKMYSVKSVKSGSLSHLSLNHWLMHKIATMEEMEVMHGLSNMNFHSPWRLGWQPTLSTQLTQSRDKYQALKQNHF